MIQHIWTCTCGHEEECERENQIFGAVYQCSACKQVWGCLYPQGGGKVWIKVSSEDVEFHSLLREPQEDDA